MYRYSVIFTVLLCGTVFICCPICLNAQQDKAGEVPKSTVEKPETTDETSAQESLSDHPLRNDPTGINWAFSLQEAIDRAKKENSIVVLKPVSFRSKNGSDALSPSAEAMRAVALVDSRVVRLLNRRFVVYYFDMDDFGDCFDREASELAKKLHPEMKYFATLPTPPMIFMTPERKMLGYINTSVSAPEMLKGLVAILAENEKFNVLNAEERSLTDPVARASVYYDLRQFDKALELIENQTGSEAYYLRGVISRETENWADMKRNFKMVTDQARLKDIPVEIGLRYWQIRNYEGLKAKFANLSTSHPRYQEAMYYRGLAFFVTNDPEACKAIWEKAINVDRTSAWAFRLDWSLGLAKLGLDRLITPYDKIPSLLGRRYMTPDGNPDMKIPK